MNVWELMHGREPTMIYVNNLLLFVIQNNFSKNAPSPLVLDHARSNPVIGIGLRMMQTFWELTKSMVSGLDRVPDHLESRSIYENFSFKISYKSHIRS